MSLREIGPIQCELRAIGERFTFKGISTHKVKLHVKISLARVSFFKFITAPLTINVVQSEILSGCKLVS